MTTTQFPLDGLSGVQQQHVRHALACLECARDPLDPRHYPALSDPALRAVLDKCLDLTGRALIAHPDGTYLTGFADDICARLAHEGLGVLPPTERAVLALVLLLSVAMPRAAGVNTGTRWTDGEPVSKADLHKCRIPDGRVDAALTRLGHLGLVAYAGRRQRRGGPQLDRLTPAQSNQLWEDLVLIAAPDSMESAVIRRNRARALGDSA